MGGHRAALALRHWCGVFRPVLQKNTGQKCVQCYQICRRWGHAGRLAHSDALPLSGGHGFWHLADVEAVSHHFFLFKSKLHGFKAIALVCLLSFYDSSFVYFTQKQIKWLPVLQRTSLLLKQVLILG